MGICLATTSGKGGTGKSTVSCGLALVFSKLNKSVLLVDMDEGLRCLDLLLGIDSNVVFDLSDILNGAPILDGTYTLPQNSNISVIPAPHQLGAIDPDALADFAKRAKLMYDIVIFDFPAGLDFSLYTAIGDDAQFLTVCNPDPVSVRDAAAVCASLPQTKNDARLIINRFDAEYIKKKIYSNIDDIIDVSGFRLLGLVPQSTELMLLSINHNINKKSRAFKALYRIAERLLGNEVRLPKIKKI
ncbi:MAG: AAA family ATPase [Clostridia bacterium]|nr:AAA family ATPase [Clostridia bacterium]